MNCITCGLQMRYEVGFYFCECGNAHDPFTGDWVLEVE